MGRLSGFLDSRAYRNGMRVADQARDRGDFPKAAHLYERLATRFPNDAGLLVLRGNMLKEAKRYAEARQSYADAIARDPASADAYLQIGHLTKLEGDLEQAAASYRRSAALDPDRTDASDELRALEPVIISSAIFDCFNPANISLAVGGTSSLLFERMKITFANKPA